MPKPAASRRKPWRIMRSLLAQPGFEPARKLHYISLPLRTHPGIYWPTTLGDFKFENKKQEAMDEVLDYMDGTLGDVHGGHFAVPRNRRSPAFRREDDWTLARIRRTRSHHRGIGESQRGVRLARR